MTSGRTPSESRRTTRQRFQSKPPQEKIRSPGGTDQWILTAIQDLRADLKNEIKDLKDDMRRETQDLKDDIKRDTQDLKDVVKGLNTRTSRTEKFVWVNTSVLVVLAYFLGDVIKPLVVRFVETIVSG